MRADHRPKQTISETEAGGFWQSRRWWVQVGHTAAGGWVAAGLTMLSVVVAARALGPHGYGAVVLALSVTTVVARFLDFTLVEAVVHHGHRALAAGDFAGLRALLRLSLRLDITLGVVIAGALVLLAEPLAGIAASDGIDPSLVRIAALGVLVVTADGTTGAVLLVADRPQVRAWALAAASLFRVIGTVVAVALGAGAEGVLFSYAVSGAAGSLVLGWLAWRVAWRGWLRAPRGEPPVSASRLVRFAFHTSSAVSIGAIGESLFPIVLGNVAGPSAVGVFRVALLPVLASDMASGPLRLVILSEQAKLHARRKISELRQGMKAYSLMALSLALPAAALGWFAMPALIELLFSASFDGAVTPARILLIPAVVQFALAWSKPFHGAVGRPHVRTVLASVDLTLTLTLLVVLGDKGAEGAAIAYTISTVTTASVWLGIVRRYLTREEQRVAQELRTAQPGPDGPPAGEVELPSPATR
jgi:O-antigen/teichoic acid export membrane protein